MSVIPRKANSGGQIPIKEIVGRDEFVQKIWYVLETQSVIMSAERRIGKTTILDLMAAKPSDRWHPVYCDVSKAHSVREFATQMCEVIHSHLKQKKRVMNRFWKYLGCAIESAKEAMGISITPENWKAALEHAIADLVHEQEDNKLVFLWDEFPQLLDNLIKGKDGPRVAMELLDTLRALRKEYSTFRVVLTGSIGLHHVLDTLHRNGYTNEPVNDTFSIEVPPLDEPAARELAMSLLLGEGISTADPEETSKTIAEEADCFPYYIHHIVRRMKLDGAAGTPEGVRSIVARQLADIDDPWQLKHYDERLDGYYPGKADLAREVLNAVAHATGPIRGSEIQNQVKAAKLDPTKKELMDLLKLLQKDHYVKEVDGGGYTFKFSLIGRWWKSRERNW